MSSLGGFAAILPAVPAPAATTSSSDAGLAKGSAAFTGVLDRIAASTADAAAPADQTATGLPGMKKGNPQPAQPDEIEPSTDDRQADIGTPPKEADMAPTLVDIAALAQAALNAPPPPAVQSTSVVPAAAQTVAPSSKTEAIGQAQLPLPSAVAASGSGGLSSAPTTAQGGTAQPDQGAQVQPGPAPAVLPSSGTNAARQDASAGPQGPAQMAASQAAREQAGPVSSKTVSPLPDEPVDSTSGADTGPEPSKTSEAPATSGTMAVSSKPMEQSPTPKRGASPVGTPADLGPQADPASAGLQPSQSKATSTGVAPQSPGTDQAKSGSAAVPPATAAVNNLPTASPASPGSGAPGSDRGGDGKSSKDDPSAVSSATGSEASGATSVSVDAFSAMSNPAQQIMTALQSLGLSKVESSKMPTGPTQSADPATDSQPAPAATVKTLTLQLDPGHLGPVSITMRLQADSVEISIAVSNPQTLQLLDRDRHMLTAAVEAAGGSRSAFQIAGATQTSGSSDQTPFGQSPQQNQSGRQDSFSANASLTGGQTQNQNRPTPSSTVQSDSDDSTPTSPPPMANRVDGSLYL